MLRLFTIDECSADTEYTGPGCELGNGGPANVVSVQSGAAGAYDETVYLDGSIDGANWVEAIGTFTAYGQQVTLNEPWALLRARQPGDGGTTGRQLTLKALTLE